MKNNIDLTRRKLLLSLGVLKFLSAAHVIKLLMDSKMAYAADNSKKYFITIRTIFDLREAARTTYQNDLAPLASFQGELGVFVGLGSNGGGSEYHNGKQKRFATASTPQNRTETTFGGGAYDGVSFDIVVGQHLKKTLGAAQDYLILGAFPYTNAFTTFETFSFSNKNLYVTPQYDLNKVYNDIKNGTNSCAAERKKYDINILKNQNKILDAVAKEYAVAVKSSPDRIKSQLTEIEKKYAGLIKANQKIIGNDGYAEGDCVEISDTPIAHTYIGDQGRTNIPDIYDQQVRKMNHLAAVALYSNFTKSVSLNYNFSGHDQPGVGYFHGATHASSFGGDQNAGNKSLDELSQFQINMFAHLINELKALDILKDTIIIYSPHERPTHNHGDVPVISYGMKAGGANLAGRGLYVHDIAADILQAFGVPNYNNFGGEKAKGGILV